VEDADDLARDIIFEIDKKKLGVNTNGYADVATEAVESITTIVPAADLERAIRKKIEEKKEAEAKIDEKDPKAPRKRLAMRGKREEVLADVTRVLKEHPKAKLFPGRIDEWAKVVVDADYTYNDDSTLTAKAAAKGIAEARDFGSFLGSWVETAKLSFGPNVYVFGTASQPGDGQRETFVVVASRKPLDLDELGSRFSDPHYHDKSGTLTVGEAYDESHLKAVRVRSRGIVLTDDYAPVENLLAPVAKTRALDD
jgi:hypothetical protein